MDDAGVILKAAQDMNGRIESLKKSLDEWDWYPEQREEIMNDIDTCKRALNRLMGSYKKIIIKIIEI